MAGSGSDRQAAGIGKPMLGFLPAGIIRKGGEILLSASFGSVLQFFFVLVVAGVNASMGGADGTLALAYIPVVCLLPLVVGTISTLVYERVKGVHVASIRGSAITAALAAMSGSFLGSLVVVILSIVMPSLKPFGPAITGPVMIAGLCALIVIISTVLAIFGAVVSAAVLNKLEK